MLASPFAFLRGGAAIMAADLSQIGTAYADQTEKDYNKLAAADKSGRIKVAGAE
jgi:hypothetical protein